MYNLNVNHMQPRVTLCNFSGTYIAMYIVQSHQYKTYANATCAIFVQLRSHEICRGVCTTLEHQMCNLSPIYVQPREPLVDKTIYNSVQYLCNPCNLSVHSLNVNLMQSCVTI